MESDFIKTITYEEVKDSNEVYHSKKEYLSASALKKIKVSPAHFKYEESKDSDAFAIGSAYHTIILEPENFDAEFFVLDETDILELLISEGSLKPRSTNKYKEWYLEQENEAAGRTIISLNDYTYLKAMQSTLHKHKYAKSLFSKGEAEKSFYCEVTTNEGWSFKVKIRPDYHKKVHRIITDLKSAADASQDGFVKSAAQYDYHIQAALYSDIMKAITGDEWPFFFVAQEKTKPYAFNIFEASNQFISQGRYEYEQLIRLNHLCEEKGYWPGYQVFCENRFGVLELKLPSWAIGEINFFNH